MNIHVGDETFRFSVEIRQDAERLIEALFVKIDRAIAEAFAEFVQNATSPDAIRTLARLIEDGRLEEAANFASQYSEPVGLRIADAYRAAALFETRMLQGPVQRVQAAPDGGGVRLPPRIAQLFDRLPRPSVSISFDPAAPRAVEAMRAMKDEFLTAFNEDARTTIHEAITKGLAEGTNPREVAKDIRQVIGLSNVQAKALVRYRQLLTDLDPEALTSVTRDRRFDATVRKAIEAGKPLSKTQIDTLVEARQRKMLKARGEAIAMNESANALNRGREEGLRQMVEASGIDPNTVTREWRSLRDGRVRHDHVAMDGQRTGMEGVFVAPGGEVLRYPHDPRAPLRLTAGCRCHLVHRIGRQR